MIIRTVRQSELNVIKSHWQEQFEMTPHQISSYFETFFQPENCYVLVHQNEILASVMTPIEEIVLHNKLIKVARIDRLYTIDTQQPQQLLHALLTYVLRDLECRTLFVFAPGKQADFFEPYGFEKVFYQNQYHLKRSHIPHMDSVGIRLRLEPEKMVELYQYFGQYFTGYTAHNAQYYQKMERILDSYKGDYVGLLTPQGHLDASLRFRVLDDRVLVDELLYRDVASMKKVLSFILSTHSRLTLKTTQAENLEKVLGVKPELTVCQWVVKLNHPDLFEQLFKVKVNKSQSAFKAFSKPLFNSILD